VSASLTCQLSKQLGFCATRGGDVGRPGLGTGPLGTSPEPLIDSYRLSMSDMDRSAVRLGAGSSWRREDLVKTAVALLSSGVVHGI